MTIRSSWILIVAVMSSLCFAQPGSFSEGQQIRVATALKVRDGAGLAASTVGVQDANALGVVLTAEPRFADGYWWWQIEYTDGMSGWSAQGDADEEFFVAISSPDAVSPASTESATSPAPPPEERTAPSPGTEPAAEHREAPPTKEEPRLHPSQVALSRINHRFPPTTVARFDPSGRLVAMRNLNYSGKPDGKLIQIYDVDSGAFVDNYLVEEPPPPFGRGVTFDLAWSPDSTQLAYCSAAYSQRARIGIIDLGTGVDTKLPTSRSDCDGDFEWREDLGIIFVVHGEDSLTVSSLDLNSLRFSDVITARSTDLGDAEFRALAANYPPRGVLQRGGVTLRIIEEPNRIWEFVPRSYFKEQLMGVSEDGTYSRPLVGGVEAMEVHPDGNLVILMGTFMSRRTEMYEVTETARPTIRYRASFPDFASPTPEQWERLRAALAAGSAVYASVYQPVNNPLTGAPVNFTEGAPNITLLAVVEIVAIDGSELIAEIRFENRVDLAGKVVANPSIISGPSYRLGMEGLWRTKSDAKVWAVLEPIDGD